MLAQAQKEDYSTYMHAEFSVNRPSPFYSTLA